MSILVCRIVSCLVFSLVAPAFGQLTVTGYKNATATLSPNGAWTLSVPAQNWKFSGSAGSAAYASSINTGTDNLGAYQELAFDYQTGPSSRSASIRVYPARPVVLFSITYNNNSVEYCPFPESDFLSKAVTYWV